MAPSRPDRFKRPGSKRRHLQSPPTASQERQKSRFSASFAGNFPCLQEAEPIFTTQSNPRRPPPASKPIMRAILDIVLIVLDLYVWLLIASPILPWLIPFNPANPPNQSLPPLPEFLYQLTNPLFA